MIKNLTVFETGQPLFDSGQVVTNKFITEHFFKLSENIKNKMLCGNIEQTGLISDATINLSTASHLINDQWVELSKDGNCMTWKVDVLPLGTKQGKALLSVFEAFGSERIKIKPVIICNSDYSDIVIVTMNVKVII